MPRFVVHSLLPDGSVRCEETGVQHATTEAGNVTCQRCKAMMETARRAAELLKIPPERWP